MTALASSAFGRAFDRVLGVYELTISELQRRLAANGYKVGLNQLSDIRMAQRRPSPELINAICKTLRLPEMDRESLHRAAARDKGFAI